MPTNNHEASTQEEPKDTFLLSESAENWLAEIAHDRFIIKHQLVLVAFAAEKRRKQEFVADENYNFIERDIDQSAIAKLYMFLHELDYEHNYEEGMTDEMKLGRLRYLESRINALDRTSAKLLEENMELKEKLEGLHLVK